MGAKVDPRGDAQVSLFQDVESQVVGIHGEVFGIGKDVKGPRRLHGDAQAQFPQSGDHVAAALVIERLHARDVVAGGGQRGDARCLDGRVGGDEKVLLHLLDGAHERGRGDEVSQAQPGHGVELGEAVKHKGVVGELQYRVFFALVHQAVVNLVGDDVGR